MQCQTWLRRFRPWHLGPWLFETFFQIQSMICLRSFWSMMCICRSHGHAAFSINYVTMITMYERLSHTSLWRDCHDIRCIRFTFWNRLSWLRDQWKHESMKAALRLDELPLSKGSGHLGPPCVQARLSPGRDANNYAKGQEKVYKVWNVLNAFECIEIFKNVPKYAKNAELGLEACECLTWCTIVLTPFNLLSYRSQY